MTTTTEPAPPGRPSSLTDSGGGAGRGRKEKIAEWAPFLVIALAIWLGWQIAIEPVVQRAPPVMALRVSPASATALSRAAEAEYLANRIANSRRFAAAALLARPFDVRALRTFGLGEADAGRLDEADQILTLSGNWSLRDSASHGWLAERRLQQGNYKSAFAHADTLARRRPGIQPQVFRLLTEAMKADPRAIPAVTELLAISPPWRTPYIDSLYTSADKVPVQAALALALQRSAAPLTDRELRQLYVHWLEAGRIPGLKELRTRLGRPAASLRLVDGSFDQRGGPYPFEWALLASPGISLEITADDLNRDEQALRVDYDGYHSGVMAQQLLVLSPGRHSLTGQFRIEGGPDDPRMAWTVTCLENGATIATVKPPADQARDGWAPFSGLVQVPAKGCTAQWLRLTPVPEDLRHDIVAWFDHLAIVDAPIQSRPD